VRTNKSEYKRTYNQEHKEEISKYNKEYRKKNKTALREKKLKYYQNHIEEARKYRQEHCQEARKYRQEHLEETSERYKKLRLLVINNYGGKCAFCGDTNTNHLCIDHVNDDGAIHRKVVSPGNLCYWLIKNNFPSGFQILCFNHNAEKQFYKTQTFATY
jgi:hypothetical protein